MNIFILIIKCSHSEFLFWGCHRKFTSKQQWGKLVLPAILSIHSWGDGVVFVSDCFISESNHPHMKQQLILYLSILSLTRVVWNINVMAGTNVIGRNCCKVIPGHLYRSENERYFFNREFLLRRGSHELVKRKYTPQSCSGCGALADLAPLAWEGPRPCQVMSHPRPGVAMRDHRAEAHPLQKPRAHVEPKQPSCPPAWNYPKVSKSQGKAVRKGRNLLFVWLSQLREEDVEDRMTLSVQWLLQGYCCYYKSSIIAPLFRAAMWTFYS